MIANTFPFFWENTPSIVFLPENELHIWQIVIDQSIPLIEKLCSYLSKDELSRMERFRFLPDQRRFIISHGALRWILGLYLQIKPEEVTFGIGSNGKPFLAPMSILPVNLPSINFNLAHSGNLALIGVARNFLVGVDVEETPLAFQTQAYSGRDDIVGSLKTIAQRYFSGYENEILQELPPDCMIEAFYRCWTRKEAFIKGVGEGLSYPLDTFSVLVKTGEPAKIRNIQPDEGNSINPFGEFDHLDNAGWILYDLIPRHGYTGAAAIKIQDWTLQNPIENNIRLRGFLWEYTVDYTGYIR
jgi:4'-phosphopantetheinyl transferase